MWKLIIGYAEHDHCLFNDTESLLEYINLHAHTETRECEFKSGVPWNNLKLKIAKATLALANLAGGGYVIVGVSKNETTNRYEPTGMSEVDSRTYNQDDVSQFVNEFTDPHIDIELKHFADDTKYYVVIQIFEFEEVPVICKKGSDETIRGRTYCRTHRKVESSPEPSVSEMREIMELAIDKGIKKQRQRVRSYGLEVDTDSFDQERSEF